MFLILYFIGCLQLPSLAPLRRSYIKMDAVGMLRDLTWADSSSIASRQATLDVVGALAVRASPHSSVLSSAILDVFECSPEHATAHYYRQLMRQWRGNSRHIGRMGSAAAIIKLLVSRPYYLL